MIDEKRFFKLAKQWKKTGQTKIYLLILKEVMVYYFDCIAGYKSKNTFVMEGTYYSLNNVQFVLNSIGYRNYEINHDEESNKIIVTFKDPL